MLRMTWPFPESYLIHACDKHGPTQSYTESLFRELFHNKITKRILNAQLFPQSSQLAHFCTILSRFFDPPFLGNDLSARDSFNFNTFRVIRVMEISPEYLYRPITAHYHLTWTANSRASMVFFSGCSLFLDASKHIRTCTTLRSISRSPTGVDHNLCFSFYPTEVSPLIFRNRHKHER